MGVDLVGLKGKYAIIGPILFCVKYQLSHWIACGIVCPKQQGAAALLQTCFIGSNLANTGGNDSSMAMRVTMGGKTFMILADTGYYSGPIMDAMWGDYLKSDMLQVAHHGQWPSVESIYHKIAAEVAIVPAKLSRYKFDITDQNWEAQTAAILSYAKDLYTACDAPTMIELSYALRNNKDQMVEDIQSYIPKPGEPTE